MVLSEGGWLGFCVVGCCVVESWVAGCLWERAGSRGEWVGCFLCGGREQRAVWERVGGQESRAAWERVGGRVFWRRWVVRRGQVALRARAVVWVVFGWAKKWWDVFVF